VVTPVADITTMHYEVQLNPAKVRQRSYGSNGCSCQTDPFFAIGGSNLGANLKSLFI